MPFILTLFEKHAYLIWPADWSGTAALAVGFFGIAAACWHWRSYQRTLDGPEWSLMAVLAAAAPVTALILGVRIPQWGALPLPNVSLDPTGGALMLLAALPAVIAGWTLGPISAAAVGLISGFFLAYWDTHSPFTIVEFSLLAVLFSVAVRQRYRTFIFSILRRPFLAAILLIGLHYLLYVVDAFFWASGSVVENLDFAISNSRTAVAAIGGSFLAAGLIAEFAVVAFPEADGISQELHPSPAESSLKVRFLGYVVWLALGLVVVLMLVNWFIAGRSAERMLRTQMANIARTTTSEIPFFFNTGQSLIAQYAGDLSETMESPEQAAESLRRSFRSIPFFSQFYLYDQERTRIAAYPDPGEQAVLLSAELQSGVASALNGVPVQVYVSPPAGLDSSTVITFIGAVRDAEGFHRGALLGVAELDSNPFTQPILSDLRGVNDINGVGYLLDEDGRVLYSSREDSGLGLLPDFEVRFQESFYRTTSSDGTRQLVYVKSAVGRPWTVMITIPSVQAQQLALDLAAPLSGMVLLIALITTGAMYAGLSAVANSLHALTEEADRIARGELDHSLQMGSRVDEVGRMRSAFEKMRRSLKDRMRELNRLLNVSRGVASSLEFESAVQTILTSALDTGAGSARVVLAPDVLPGDLAEHGKAAGIGRGEHHEKYGFLDAQILEIVRDRSPVQLTNPSRMPLLEFGVDDHIPGAVLAVALRHEQRYYGSLWLAYEEPHSFPDSEIRFMVTLAGQAALAASNSQLFRKAEIGRQRLAAILASTPDPILVTDSQDRLLLINPAAEEMIELDAETGVGEPLEAISRYQGLVDLLSSSPNERVSREITAEDGRVFLATASPVVAEGTQLGRVCVLRDITQLKEVDELKSDFVATVSHDLRSPLTLMRGYATMLEMVGELNEQQQSYVQNIVSGVESMSHLVQNLLDLGRIEAEVGLKLEMVSPADIVEEVTDNLQLQARQRGIELQVVPPSQNVPFISADKALLQQALHNLVDNAVDFNVQDGKIWVRYSIAGDQITFEVEDTGIGISPVDQQRLFEKFYRIERSGGDQGSGTGLGLAIVRSIAEQHGGSVWVESELGHGSIFYLSLPIRPSGKKIRSEKDQNPTG